jgi:tRNA/tmRNA/rRNA uracil-C5-methylase (TrmA/RlmC/RlmD family)
LNQLAHDHGLPQVRVAGGAPAKFRLRARLAIRGRLGSPKIGLFELGTHRVVHIPNCRVQHPLINRVANVMRRALVEARVTSYSDRAHSGIARYLQVVVERSSQRAQVVLVANSATAEPLAECSKLVGERLGADLHSLWFNANPGTGNTILGPVFERIMGEPTLVETFGGARIYYPPGAFGQSNLDVAEHIIRHVGEHIPAGARVAEFYAGVGAIGLSLLGRMSELRVNEASPHSLEGLALGIENLEPAERAKVSVIAGAAGSQVGAADGAAVVIVDPPRKGLDPELTAALRDHPPERLIYVSCGLDSLIADVSVLTSKGSLRLAGLAAFDLIPYTDHVETVAVLERR